MAQSWTPQPLPATLAQPAPSAPTTGTWSDAWLTADDQRAWR